MAIIKSVRGFDPKYGDNCFFAENAVIRTTESLKVFYRDTSIVS